MCTKRENFRCKNGFAPDDRLRYSNGGGGGAGGRNSSTVFHVFFYFIRTPLLIILISEIKRLFVSF